MWRCMAGERSVAKGYQNILLPFGFKGITAIETPRTQASRLILGAACTQGSKPKAESRACPIKKRPTRAMPAAYPACRFTHSSVRGGIDHRKFGRLGEKSSPAASLFREELLGEGSCCRGSSCRGGSRMSRNT